MTPAIEILSAIVRHTETGGMLRKESPLIAMAQEAMRNMPASPVETAEHVNVSVPAAKPAPPLDKGEVGQKLGLFKRIGFEVYAAAAGTNFSRLKDLLRSPLLYQHNLSHQREDTGPMRLGSCAHTAILEPHRFLAEYALWDERTEDDKVRPRKGKDWEAFVLANPGKRIVRADEHATAMAMRDAVRAHPAAIRYLRSGDPEVSMWWKDQADERLCKGRADWITTVDRVPVLVGIKTARDVRPIQFGNAAAKMAYHLQWPPRELRAPPPIAHAPETFAEWVSEAVA